MQFRHEFKQNINYCDYAALCSRLKALLKPDKVASQTGVYLIRSLYFDNADDKALREKAESVNIREKFRLRYYNNDDSFIRLEKKSKINGLCSKQSVEVTKEMCESIINGEIAFLVDSGDPLLTELYCKIKYQQLRPKTIVQYTREAYIFPAGNVRITFDSNIRSGITSTDFFNKELVTLGVQDSGIILEVKYDAFIPQFVSDILQMNNRRTIGFSKYEACRIV